MKACTKEQEVGDALQRALKYALEVVYDDHVVGVYTRNYINHRLAEVKFDPDVDFRELRRGWAKKPKWGEGLRSNTLSEFKDQIQEGLDIGSSEPGKKISAPRMHRMLERMHPNRYGLLTENQINIYVCKLSREDKKKRNMHVGKRLAPKKEISGKEGTLTGGGVKT